MGREIRRVSADWKHPEGKVLFGSSFEIELADWKEGHGKWQAGYKADYANFPVKAWMPREDSDTGIYSEWAGRRPCKGEYMPSWTQDEATHFQMYETCTEGSPISPVFATPEEVARWCADNGASASGSQTANYDQWLAVALGEYACTFAISPKTGGKLTSGVAAAALGEGDKT